MHYYLGVMVCTHYYIFAVPILGAQVVIEEAVMKKSKMMDGEGKIGNTSPDMVMMNDNDIIRQQQCAKRGQSCNPGAGPECCEDLFRAQPCGHQYQGDVFN